MSVFLLFLSCIQGRHSLGDHSISAPASSDVTWMQNTHEELCIFITRIKVIHWSILNVVSCVILFCKGR